MFDSYLPNEQANSNAKQSLLLAACDRVLIVAPHPDDETLAAGGLIQQALERGAAVRVLIATSGENNPWPQRAVFWRWSISQQERGRWSERRIREAQTALAKLGLGAKHVAFLAQPDYALTELAPDDAENLIRTLAEEIRSFQPTLVISPSLGDRHPDHNALALYTHFALERCGVSAITDLRFRIHGPRAPFLTRSARYLDLDAAQRARKRDAVLSHASQMILSRRRFLSCVREQELFFEGPDFDSLDDRIRISETSQGQWRVESMDTYLGGATVTLAIAAHAVQFTLPLIARGRMSVARPGDYTALQVEISPRILLVTLHSDVDADTVCLKLRLRSNFLDYCGWQRLRPAVRSVTSPDRVCAVIPCYNIAAWCEPVVREAAAYADIVVAVDDGSTDGTRGVLEAVAGAASDVQVLVHGRNRGKGAALLSAFRHALANVDFDVMVTLDGDAQHRPQDIPRLVDKLKRTRTCLCIGERDAFDAMPFKNRLGNKTTRALLHLMYPHGPADTQSGFRAMTREFVTQIAHAVRGRRYETELSILLTAMERGDGVTGVAIPTVYLDGNRSSHFNPLVDSMHVLMTLFRGWAAKHKKSRLCATTSSPRE